MKTVLLAVMALIVSGCVATHERAMNESEKTVVSDQVLAMVDEAGGTLDIREKPEVYCKRIRITGSHMVTRVCYTDREDKAMADETQATYYRRFGQHNRSRDGN